MEKTDKSTTFKSNQTFSKLGLIVICEIRILLFLTHEWQCKLLKWPFDIIIAVKRRKANTEGQDYVNEVAMPKVGLPYILQSSCRSSIIFPGTTSQIVL